MITNKPSSSKKVGSYALKKPREAGLSYAESASEKVVEYAEYLLISAPKEKARSKYVVKFNDFKQVVIHADSRERIERIRNGIGASCIVPVSEYFRLSREAIGEIIGISTATMNRKIKANALLSPAESEKLERIAEIENEAENVFGDSEKAKFWLLNKNHALGVEPLKLLDTEVGALEVRKVLNAIAYGGVV